jgi:hypothetical protein
MVFVLVGTALPALAHTAKRHSRRTHGRATALMPDPAPQNPFSPTSVWNAPIASNAPLSANSSMYVANLVRQVNIYGTWINSQQYSTPVYQVAINQPRVSVYIDHSAMYTNAADAAVLALEMSRVPIPPNAQPAAGSDHHMIIWQPSTDTEWELWLAKRVVGMTGVQWHAGWGARIDHVSQSSGIAPYPYGATASGVSELGGLITANEISNAQINHALAMAIPEAEGWGQYVWPANRTDGRSAATDAIPEGTRFRLDPTLNVDSLGLPPVTRAIALAAQRYGIVMRDTAGAVVFYAEAPSDVGLTDYSWGQGLDPAQLLSHFPWSRLQVVAVPPNAQQPGGTPTSTQPSGSPSLIPKLPRLWVRRHSRRHSHRVARKLHRSRATRSGR